MSRKPSSARFVLAIPTLLNVVDLTLLGTSGGNLLVGALADHFRNAGVTDPVTGAATWTMLP